MDAVIVQIAKIELRPGDTLAVMVPKQISNDQFHQLRHHLQSLLPDGVKVAIFADGMTIAKISAADDAVVYAPNGSPVYAAGQSAVIASA